MYKAKIICLTAFLVTLFAGTRQPVEGAKISIADAHHASPEINKDARDEFRWHKRIAPGQAIEINGMSGNIRAEAASGTEVEVTATKRGPRDDASMVKLQVVEHAEGATICAIYPSLDPNTPDQCVPGQNEHRSRPRNYVQIDFVVRVPAGIRFIGRNVNGDVDATSLSANVFASTINGWIHISTKGYAQASTINGSIVASLGSANWAESLLFHTINGNITVELPASASTTVVADTVSGGISTNFPLTVRNYYGRQSVDGSIGGGGRDLSLTTINGHITLRSMP